MKVVSIKKEETYEWLLYKDYAKRSAPISYAFGLFNKSELVGVITFGCPPNKEYNDGKCIFKKLKILRKPTPPENFSSNKLDLYWEE